MYNVQCARLRMVRGKRQALGGGRVDDVRRRGREAGRALGLPDVRRVFVPHPIQDATDDEMRAKADAIVERLIEALTS